MGDEKVPELTGRHTASINNKQSSFFRVYENRIQSYKLIYSYVIFILHSSIPLALLWIVSCSPDISLRVLEGEQR
jgi:hypothetical protein